MSANATAASPVRAGPREWLGLAVLTLPILLIAMDNTVLFLALPHISADLDASGVQMLWIQDVYGFVVAGFLITMGTLGDRIGRRRLLLIGAAAFGVASIVAAYSTSAEMLILTRALLGVAGATLAPSTLALIRNMFPDARQRTAAISILMTCFMLGATVGPVVGGALLEHFWWGSAFLIGAPVMVLTLVLGPVLLPEYRDPRGGRLDLFSVALSLAAILPVIYGIKEIAEDGLAAVPAALIVVGAVFAALFVRRQNRLAAPLLDLRLFRVRAFRGALGTLLAGQFIWGGVFLLLSQYVQLVLGESPIGTGLWLLPATIVMAAAALVVPGLAARHRPDLVIAGGLLVAAAGFVLLGLLDAGSGRGLLVAGMVLAFGGLAPLMLLTTDMVVASAPPEKAGSAAAMSETSSEFGIALGIAVLGSVGGAVYRAGLDGSLPAGLPERTVEAVRDSLVEAAAAAERLPGALGDQVLDVAREAFTGGLNATALTGAVLAVGVAAAVVRLLRGVRPAPEGQDEDAADRPDGVPAHN
ncbi:MFS transporter [Thermomonospora cellulosilytica]|uniref:DHA2 family multidrug resistance protein-like MFS transporter n=1 Tax=Thermomonospora cellulosilytica TaxID=1411118 RepID=A0A7W3MWF9_9ACTN|nr:MFS transporter [Thermomonospora cellulosilytica]MBA9003143.1 DHA2 family multidrug resistance protein-like MFS transporter [Thermomonospora cellulosilytica]